MKGQTMETLGFVILAVTVIGVILFIRIYLIGGYGRTFLTLAERQQTEGLRSGVNSILQTTETKSGRKMIELIGTSVYLQNDTLNFGNVVGDVNVKEEVRWRFDNIYGKGKWYLRVEPPVIIPPIQVIMIVDTSASLCDDIEEIKENVPKIIESVREKEKNITATIYLLPSGIECCAKKPFKLSCEGVKFSEKEYFKCKGFDQASSRGKGSTHCETEPKNFEDWGTGLSCAIGMGPAEGWIEESIKIGIIISDELSYGNELCEDEESCCVSSESEKSLIIGIEAAKEMKVKVFPLKASTLRACCDDCDNCPDDCNECLMWWDEDWKWVETPIFAKENCLCHEKVTEQMNKLAEETGGKLYELKNASEVSKYIEDILNNIEYNVKPLEVGTEFPENKNVKTETIPVPINYIGEYSTLYFYHWS